MATKRKNSNYVTEKTIAAKKAKEALARKKKIKKIVTPIAITCVAIALLVAIVFAIGVPQGMIDYTPTATEHVVLTVKGYEDTPIHIEIYGNDAPKTADRFMDMVEAKTFNLSEFLSVKDGLVYFGDENADGGKNGIEGEFASNINSKGERNYNDIIFRKGVIGMSRAEDDYNSGYSQFFICTKSSTHLNGDYAAFAKITSGYSVIKDIVKNAELDENGNFINAPQIVKVESHDASSH